MIKYLQSFMPFVMGIEERLYSLAEPYLEEGENIIFVVFIEKNKIVSNVSKESWASTSELLGELPIFPHLIYLELRSDLIKFKDQVLINLIIPQFQNSLFPNFPFPICTLTTYNTIYISNILPYIPFILKTHISLFYSLPSHLLQVLLPLFPLIPLLRFNPTN